MVDARIRVKHGCQDKEVAFHCLQSKVIKVSRAEYSRKEQNICSGRRNGVISTEHCSPVNKSNVARELCDGQVRCRISVNQSTLGDHCLKALPYLSVFYTCGKSPV